ncbi:hypothetical protein KUCAC02_028845 [Chaenocephalus aceratus]|uniref:Uncharacterized protein n=1 Tax=Chaenocephalus aceratus TaxID=36190 RepID=A0ACB9X388_CHAAC|nr:hypothetical protein KUCAC02_028845 [Chaenocephalus aceratus]
MGWMSENILSQFVQPPIAAHSCPPSTPFLSITWELNDGDLVEAHSLMESEESLEVASVSSTSPQIRHTASAQHCLAFSPFTPWANPILSGSLFISSVSPQRTLPHVN